MKHPAIIILLLAALLAACASIGTPDGGRFDETPPVIVATSPQDKSILGDRLAAFNAHRSRRKVKITFDEFIRLENASEKIIISPPQDEQPDIYTTGKSVVMTLYDTLRTNTTYTIDFGDAIVDNNESNPLGNYTYSFSTGTVIDTLEIGGYVLAAENLEPVKGILVGLYNIDTLTVSQPDTLLSSMRLERVSRTDANGRFSIKGVAQGQYRVYALGDMDGDYRFSQKSEQVAFDTTVYVPSFKPDLRHDTVWIDTTRYEKILHTPYTHFLPDDIVLRAFLEDGQSHYLLKTERPDPLRFTLFFTSPCDSLPTIEILTDSLCHGDSSRAPEALLIQPNATRDTLLYWITDTALAYADTLSLRVTYLQTDSLDALVPQVDTLWLVPKLTRHKQLSTIEEQADKWVKSQTKRLQRYEKKLQRFTESYPDSVYPYHEVIDTVRSHCPFYTPVINVTLRPASNMSPAQNIMLTATEPIALADTAHISFTRKVDSLWVKSDYMLMPDTLNPCMMTLFAEWRPGERYKIESDSVAIRSVYGHYAKPLKHEINVSSLDTYGSLYVRVRTNANPTASPIIVQLLNKSDKVLREQTCDADGRADFFFLSPAEIYMRCFIDIDGDGKWTTGDYTLGRQPEPVYYFPRSFPIKAKWEIEQEWNLDDIPVLQQKPSVLVKQKDKTKRTRGAHERNLERDSQNAYGQRNKQKK